MKARGAEAVVLEALRKARRYRLKHAALVKHREHYVDVVTGVMSYERAEQLARAARDGARAAALRWVEGFIDGVES